MVSRYILSRSQFSVNRVKPAAFLPPDDGRLSVFGIDGLFEAGIWSIGMTWVAQPRGATLYARADVASSAVEDSGLRVDVDNTPPRHANVIGWPDEKSAQKLKAGILAEAASLRLAPPA